MVDQPPQEPGGLTEEELMLSWAKGERGWNSLPPAVKDYIRKNIVVFAKKHPELFPVNVNKSSPHQLIVAVNKGGGQPGTNQGGNRPGGNNQDGTAPKTIRGLPGKLGVDYQLVQRNGQYYVVYSVAVKGPSGKRTIQLAWGVSKEQAKTLGLSLGKARQLTAGEWKNVQNFGPVTEILDKGLEGEHPLQTYMRKLYDLFGRKASWVQDKEVLEIYLMAWAEGWSDADLYSALKRTNWYQTRTDAQRTWEMDTTRAQKKKNIELLTTRLKNDIMDLWGPTFDWTKIGISNSQIAKMAEDIASGKYGDPEAGYEIVMDDLKREAEKVEGTNAWIDYQQSIQDQNDFLNEPENMLWNITQQALQWLGPSSKDSPLLSQGTLEQWAKDLVSGAKSDADWQTFLQQTAQTLYPWLPANTPWQQAVDPYRALAEQVWGRPVPWESPVLQKLTRMDANGTSTGTLMDFGDWETLLRGEPEFWTGPVAEDEGWEFLARLDNIFHGVV